MGGAGGIRICVTVGHPLESESRHVLIRVIIIMAATLQPNKDKLSAWAQSWGLPSPEKHGRAVWQHSFRIAG